MPDESAAPGAPDPLTKNLPGKLLTQASLVMHRLAHRGCEHEGAIDVHIDTGDGKKRPARWCKRCRTLLPAGSKSDRSSLKKAIDALPVATVMPRSLLLKAVSAGCFRDPKSCGLRWITAHPGGPNSDGVPLLVHDNGDEYTVVGGAGGHLNQLVMKKPKDHDAEARRQIMAQRRERRIQRQKEYLESLGQGAQDLHEKAQSYKQQAKAQLSDLEDKVLGKLAEKMGGGAPGSPSSSDKPANVLDMIRQEARKRALIENGEATEAEQNAFADKAEKSAVTEARKAARQVLQGALDKQAARALGDEDMSPAEFSMTISSKRLVRQFTDDELNEFVEQSAHIAQLKGAARAIERSLTAGDNEAASGVEAALRPLSPEEVQRQNLDRYLNEKSVDTHTALVKGSEEASTINQRRNQSNGAADGLNSFVAANAGSAILNPDTVRQIGIENAARVAAAYLVHKTGDKATAKTAAQLRRRIETQSTASAAAALERVSEMDALVDNAKAAANAGDGSVTKNQASILAANMAALKYRLLNTTRGQLRAAAALVHHIENPTTRPLSLPGGDSATAAHALAKSLGLSADEYETEKAERGSGGGWRVVVPAENLHKIARPHSIAESDSNIAMDELRQDVEANPGQWRSKGFRYGPQEIGGKTVEIMLQPHQELGARAIIQQKRMVLNYGAGSGKTPTLYAALGDLIANGKIDHALVTMPAKPRAQQGGPGGEAAKFLTPEIAGKVAVVQDGADLKKQLKRVKSGDVKILVMSPHLMREKVDDLKAAGFGGKRSATIFDEAHEFAIGSNDGEGSGMAKAARQLADAEYMAAMSGTLIESNASELHSIYDMVHPGALGSQKAFAEEWKRLAGGQGDLFASESMRGMRARLSGGMVSYHKPVTRPSGEPLTLERNTLTVEATPAQKAAISEAHRKYKEERQSSDPAIAKAAALRRDARIKRILTAGVKDKKTGEIVNPKFEAAKAILDAEKGRADAIPDHLKNEPAIKAALASARPENRVGIYAFERAPLRNAASAAGGKFVTITGDDDDKATEVSVRKINDRANDVDGVALSNAANYGVNLQGMDHLIKLHPLDVPSKEDQLDHRHFRTGQTRDVRATTILSNHPAEQTAQFRTTRVKLPEVALLATLADDTHHSEFLVRNLKSIEEMAGEKLMPSTSARSAAA